MRGAANLFDLVESRLVAVNLDRFLHRAVQSPASQVVEAEDRVLRRRIRQNEIMRLFWRKERTA